MTTIKTIVKQFLSKKVIAGFIFAILSMAIPAQAIQPNNNSETRELSSEEIAALKQQYSDLKQQVEKAEVDRQKQIKKEEKNKQRRERDIKIAAGTALATIATCAALKYAHDNVQLPAKESIGNAVVQTGKFGGYAALTAGSLACFPISLNLFCANLFDLSDREMYTAFSLLFAIAGGYGTVEGIKGMANTIAGK